MTIPLFQNLEKIRRSMECGSKVLLGLDYDGTLTPIVDDPSEARMPAETRELLRSLASRACISVAVISGRTLEDIRTLVNLDGLIYAGNHGLDISGPGLRFIEPGAVAEIESMTELACSVRSRLAEVAGALVEDKALTISIHYRCVAPSEREQVFRHVHAAVAEAGRPVRITRGHKVLEVRPCVNWHKGKAAGWIQEQLGHEDSVVLYLGDDLTDEDVFLTMPGAVTVKVGAPEATRAAYHVGTPSCVQKFLHWLHGVIPESSQKEVS